MRWRAASRKAVASSRSPPEIQRAERPLPPDDGDDELARRDLLQPDLERGSFMHHACRSRSSRGTRPNRLSPQPAARNRLAGYCDLTPRSPYRLPTMTRRLTDCWERRRFCSPRRPTIVAADPAPPPGHPKDVRSASPAGTLRVRRKKAALAGGSSQGGNALGGQQHRGLPTMLHCNNACCIASFPRIAKVSARHPGLLGSRRAGTL
jgi:hypothetical protein